MNAPAELQVPAALAETQAEAVLRAPREGLVLVRSVPGDAPDRVRLSATSHGSAMRMRPTEEPFRFAQEPSLIFAPAPVSRLRALGGGRAAATRAAGVRLPGPERRAADPPDRVRPRTPALPRRPHLRTLPRHSAASLRPVLLPGLGAGAAGRRAGPSARRSHRPPHRLAVRADRAGAAKPRRARRLPQAVLRRPAGPLGARCRRPGGLARAAVRRCRSGSSSSRATGCRSAARSGPASCAMVSRRSVAARCSARRSGTCSTSFGSSSGRCPGSASPGCCLTARCSSNCAPWSASTSASSSPGTCASSSSGRTCRPGASPVVATGGVGRLGRTAWLNGNVGFRRTADADDLVMNVESIRLGPEHRAAAA